MADLQVIGLDVAFNRQKKDAKTGKQILDPETENAIKDKIEAIATASKELIKRGKKVELNLAAQQPLIREKLLAAIRKNKLLKKTGLPAAKPGPKRLTGRRRRR